MELTGDPEIDALLLEHTVEIQQMELLAASKAKENEILIAKIKAGRAKRKETNNAA